ILVVTVSAKGISSRYATQFLSVDFMPEWSYVVSIIEELAGKIGVLHDLQAALRHPRWFQPLNSPQGADMILQN
ncbi:MAG: hypothetical protein ABSG91_22060, partial [Syntrophobacteraceae bacterium]